MPLSRTEFQAPSHFSHGPDAPANAIARILRRPVAIAVVALALRLLVMTAEHTYKTSPDQESFGLGWETGRIAYSIATGQGFSSPFHGSTGPTAWVAPLYPYFVAGVFKIFGIYSDQSAWVLLALNSLFSALTCLTIYSIAKETLDEKIALWSAWLWAVLPYSMYWAIRWVWETSLSAFLLSAAFMLALRLKNSDSVKTWALFGLAWGAIALSNPSLLSLLPFALGWACYQRLREHKKWMGPAAAAIVIFLLCVMPWMIRNYEVFGRFVFIRSNFGAELRLGNYEDADGLWKWQRHPSQNTAEFEAYRQMGELRFARQRGHEAMEFIRKHPAMFTTLSLKRAYYFWFGTPRASGTPGLSRSRYLFFLLSTVLGFGGLWLMIKQKKPGAFLYASLILIYPLVYYITFPHPRYRHPIEPEMMILGVWFMVELCRSATVKSR
ncbi:MAG TPA: glycosyltransferase family 39 protein [Terriglobales bacterium]|jgi:4-amino-4-deoxy-L-arabinose transferase-like glycosyltransferase|nr:glycosyltransferase family 39 protein [Terriglobales bacterium]